MKINIKIKYLILGLGIGIIITSTLYSFCPEIKYLSLTNEEIIEKAKELGMINFKESISLEPIKKEDEESLDEPDIEDNQPLEEDDVGDEIELEVVRGENSTDIAKKLFEYKIIDNYREFELYAREKKVDKQLKYGVYKFKPKSSYDEIIKILLKEK